MIRWFTFVALLAQALAQVRSPTGRRISLNALPDLLPQPIFEYKNGVLLGPNLRVAIALETLQINTKIQERTTLSINGNREVPHQRAATEVRYGKGFTFLFSNGNLLSVSGETLNLVMLKGHPGLFINTFSTRSSTEDGSSVDVDWDDEEILIPSENLTYPSRLFKSVKRASSCSRGDRHVYEIAIAYDNTFCAIFDNNEAAASAMIQVLVDGANVPYKRDTCVTLSLVHIEAHCKDRADPYLALQAFRTCPDLNPGYSCTPSKSILYNFRQIWNRKRASVKRDGAFLFTAFDLGTYAAGIAFIGAACSNYGYGWTDGISLKSFAHEIGHTLGGRHRYTDGILKQGNILKFRFQPQTVAEFKSFIDSSKGSCITTDDAVCDARSGGCSSASCPNNKCLKGQNVPSPLVPCSQIAGNYFCPKEIVRNHYIGVACPNDGYDYIRRKNDPKDPSIICCEAPTATKTKKMINRFTSLLTLLNIAGTIYENHMRNWAAVKTETLMKTRAVPACRAGSGRAVPASRKGKQCSRTMPDGTTFMCVQKRFARLKKAKVGNAEFLINQRFGKFAISARAAGGSKLRNIRIRVSSNSLSDPTFVPTKILASTSAEHKISFNPFSLSISTSRGSCCSMPLYILVNLTLENRSSGKKNTWSAKVFMYRMQCERVCKKRGSRTIGRTISFSASTACPSCKV